MRVAWLGEPAWLDEELVGGKTANLSRLATSFQVRRFLPRRGGGRPSSPATAMSLARS
ncbi:MAG TPA: hypothetical protein VGR46_06720 [Candidatus Limnocylindria bacterium]|nr:hypothetical protein [Candidatus Limnocylindria bacterium]